MIKLLAVTTDPRRALHCTPALFALLGVLVSPGCGGEATASSNSGGDYAAACRAEKEAAKRCADGGKSENYLCATYGEACVRKLFRQEAMAVVSECFSTSDCSKSDDCWENAKLTPSKAAEDWVPACQARRSECQSQFTGSDQDFFCWDLSAASDQVLAAQLSCLKQSCPDIRDCQSTAKAYNFCE